MKVAARKVKFSFLLHCKITICSGRACQRTKIVQENRHEHFTSDLDDEAEKEAWPVLKRLDAAERKWSAWAASAAAEGPRQMGLSAYM